jgi:hypothetical protein
MIKNNENKNINKNKQQWLADINLTMTKLARN